VSRSEPARISGNTMRLEMNIHDAEGYTSNSQRARRITEAWACANLYCAACDSNSVLTEPCNTKATDFSCPSCSARYQLKASKSWNERRIPDAGYHAMIAAIRQDQTPNLLVMQYTPNWNIKNLLLIPSFFFAESAVERRKPLSPTARRAGWIGCNILLSEIATEGKIQIVVDSHFRSSASIRQQYQAIRPLTRLKPALRGWILDVLRVVESLGVETFTLPDVYSKEQELAELHPENLHVRAKIRQQMQVLRDLGLITFNGAGKYSLMKGRSADSRTG
jgi:type II restriction enzyme